MSGLSITVDVDGEAGLPDGGRGWEHRLTSRSERAYGLRRGVPRLLDALAGREATFYVPGTTALAAPELIAELIAAGHEIGHHGHRHLRTDEIDAAGERAELEDGLEALTAAGATRPTGYRSPGWELTPRTLELLGDLGFAYDSSLMDDDRPYRLRAGHREIVELPVHWALDDAPHFATTTDPSGLWTVWLAELQLAAAEDRHLTFTLHPEILGRPHRVELLLRLLENADRLAVEILPHRAAATAAASRLPFLAGRPAPATPGPLSR